MKRTILCEFYHSSGTLIRVVQGDLTQEPVEAIVNAANENLAHGGGVAGAIVRAGGREIQRQSDAWIARHGRVPTGRAAITGAGRLPCDHVIHAVGPIWRGKGDEDQLLASAVNSALELAAEHGIKSIALPGISTGIYGFPKQRGASVIVNAVLTAVEEFEFNEINLTNIDAQTANIFADVARELLD